MKICKAILLLSLITSCGINAREQAVTQLLDENIEQRFSLTFIEKLLLIEPDSVDKFSLLEQDIQRFNSELDSVTKSYSASVVKFNKYKTDTSNEHNMNEEFILFNQLENQRNMDSILAAEYEVNKVRAKLYYSLFEYESIKKRVESLYQQQRQSSLELLKAKLLAGESFVVLEEQKQSILNFLLEQQAKPEIMASILSHQNVQEILPDYLIEQINIFDQSNISLAQALSNNEVMQAVVNKIRDVDVLPKMGLEDIGATIYSEQQAPKVLQLGSAPLLLDTYLDASIQRSLNLARIYELPIPSKDIVTSN